MNNRKQYQSIVHRIVVCLMLSIPFLTIAQEAQVENDIIRVEYFWDTDPGYGKATPLPITQGEEVDITTDIAVPDTMANGTHRLFVRAKTVHGWSPVVERMVAVKRSVKNDIIRVEYYWDTDPGYGKATPLPITQGEEVDITTDIAVPDTMANGTHRLFVRAKTAHGWSPVVERLVAVKRSEKNDIIRVEYYWDTDPGYGKATPLSFTQGEEVSIDTDIIPADTLSGEHLLVIRAQSSMGHWSPVCADTINVGLEGHFTLNETLPAGTDRNFISLTELFETLIANDVRGDIDVTVRDGVTFEYDATTAEALTRATGVKVKFEQNGKHILFKATEGSSTTLAFTSTEVDKSAMVGVVSSFMSENVTITLNGMEYNFNTFNNREQEICSGESSEELDFTGLSSDENVTVAWKIKPRTDMAVTGYVPSGTGNLPAMTLVNNTKAVDYVEYDMALLCGVDTVMKKTHIIYVHTRVSEKRFTTMTPKDGASVDPKSQTLSWNSILGANGYRVNITKVLTSELEAGNAANAVVTEVEVATNSYTFDVESGYSYSWYVVASGRCDVLQSGVSSFTGRLLPDLTASIVNAPEYAYAGAPTTITVTVANNGAGATTETLWTDALYYSTTSADITTATKLASVAHSGSIAAGETYDVTFEFKMPFIDEGVIYLFAKTDIGETVMESNDENNSIVSSAIDCEPFIMTAEAHAALTALYNATGGANWTKIWNIASDNITEANYYGVTFNAEGVPTSIVLENNGLVGDVTNLALALPKLITLNLSKNQLTGDVTTLANSLSALTTLNLSYNRLNGLSGVLPATITSLNLKYQYRSTNNYFMAMDEFTPVKFMIGENVNELKNRMVGELHALEMYSHTNSDFNYKPSYSIYDISSTGKGTLQGSVNYNSVTDVYTFSACGLNNYDYDMDQDHVMMLANTNPWVNSSAYPVIVSWKPADSNMDAITDVLDVQHTLNELLGTRDKKDVDKGFNYAAADLNFDDNYNILDVVKTVNIVIENQNVESEATNSLMASGARLAQAAVFADENMIVINSLVDVAAIDVILSGVTSSQIRQKLSKSDFQMSTRDIDGGVRIVIFSPIGEVIPAGETVLFTMSNYGVPTWVKCADVEANEIKAIVSDDLTSVPSLLMQQSIAVNINEGKLLVKCADEIGSGHVEVYSTTGCMVYCSEEVEFKQGVNQFAANLIDGVYIVKVIADDDCFIGKVK